MRHANGTINHTYCKCFRLSLTDEMCNFSALQKLGDLHIVLASRGLCKVRTGWRRMADGGWRIEKCGWKNADDKMRMTK